MRKQLVRGTLMLMRKQLVRGQTGSCMLLYPRVSGRIKMLRQPLLLLRKCKGDLKGMLRVWKGQWNLIQVVGVSGDQGVRPIQNSRKKPTAHILNENRWCAVGHEWFLFCSILYPYILAGSGHSMKSAKCLMKVSLEQERKERGGREERKKRKGEKWESGGCNFPAGRDCF